MPMNVRQARQWLRRHFPTKTPVVIRVHRSQPGLHGQVLIGDGRALVRVTKDTDAMMCESLLEEWAHVLRHDTPIPIEDEHDPIFWAILAAVTKKWRGE